MFLTHLLNLFLAYFLSFAFSSKTHFKVLILQNSSGAAGKEAISFLIILAMSLILSIVVAHGVLFRIS